MGETLDLMEMTILSFSAHCAIKWITQLLKSKSTNASLKEAAQHIPEAPPTQTIEEISRESSPV